MKIFLVASLALVTFCAVSGCAGLGKSFADSSARGPHLGGVFRRSLKNNRPVAKQAAQILFPTGEVSAEWRAQYYLQTCEWRKAFREIETLPAEKRPLFRAVLAALPAVRRPPALKEGSAKLNPGEWRMRVPSGEIWRDEWSELILDSMCDSPGQEGLDIDTEALKAAARENFSLLKFEDFFRDFNIVALALDVEFPLSDVPALLDHFEAYRDSRYYRQLADLVPAPVKTVAVKQGTNSVRIGTLEFTEVVKKAHEIRVPWLLGEI